MSGSSEDVPDEAPGNAPNSSEVALLHTRAPASPLTPLMTAPLSVEKLASASGGPASLAVAVNDTLRKTGALRGLRMLRRANQDGGFDCPGCAWPDPERPPRFAVCESGVRAIVDEVGQRRAGPQLFATYTIPELSRRSDYWLAAQGRLTHPMVRRPAANAYEPITWDEAIELCAAALRELDAPTRAVFYSSARVSNEAAFCLALLAREHGSNNLPSSSQLCHEASRVAMERVLGHRRGGVEPSDFDEAEAIFVFGQNPGSNHPRMLDALRAAKLRGAQIVAVNPLRELGLVRARDPKRLRDWLGPGTDLADLLLSVSPGGDLALLEGLSKAVLEAGAVEREFIDAHTEGFAELEAALARRSWAEIVARSGVEREQIQAAADIYIRSRATITCWGVGLTQHRRGVETLELLLSWMLLRANIGKPGAGPLPVLGHSNTGGCWTMGVTSRPSEELLAGLERATGLSMPREPGFGFGEAVEAMRRGEVELLLGLGGNMLSCGPDTEALAEGLRRCRLSVHLATKLNRSHLLTGETGLLLPCRVRSEVQLGAAGPQWSSFEDATGCVVASQGRERPVSEAALAEPEILARIAAAARPDSALDWPSLGRDHDRIRELIAAALPECRDFAGALGPRRRLRLASPVRTRSFATPSGRAHLCAPADEHETEPPAEGALVLTTLRSHDQHNSNVYWVGDRERGIHGYRRVVLMNYEDMQRLGVEPYTQIDLISHFEGRTRRADKWVAIPHHVRAGCIAAYFPEANVLVPAGAVDPRSGTPSFKAVVVTIAAPSASGSESV